MLGKLAAAATGTTFAFAMAATLALASGTLGGGGGEEDTDDSTCGSGHVPDDEPVPGLAADQTQVARTVIAEGEAAGVPTRGLVVALATAAVESGVRNLDHGDRDSLGVFQQRPSAGWGSPAELTDVSYAAAAFFGGSDGPNSLGSVSEPPGLLDIDGWERLPIGDAAQAVQRSAFPDRYAEWEDEARAWVEALTGTGRCVALPIASSDYMITSQFGWRFHPLLKVWKLHDGTDFAAPAGTPVVAVAPGEVTEAGSSAWAGPHLVEIDHGNGHVSVYGHMNVATVALGDKVEAGEQVGAVGSEGLSSGPHLHLTIRRDGEPIDPERWYRRHGVTP